MKSVLNIIVASQTVNKLTERYASLHSYNFMVLSVVLHSRINLNKFFSNQIQPSAMSFFSFLQGQFYSHFNNRFIQSFY